MATMPAMVAARRPAPFGAEAGSDRRTRVIGRTGSPCRAANRLSNRAVKDASRSDRHAETSRVSSRREVVAWAKVWRAEKPWR
jgi:hypothetical protein